MCLCLFVRSAAGRAYILEHGVASRSDTNTKLSSAIGKNWHECRNVLSLGRCAACTDTQYTHTRTPRERALTVTGIFSVVCSPRRQPRPRPRLRRCRCRRARRVVFTQFRMKVKLVLGRSSSASPPGCGALVQARRARHLSLFWFKLHST